MLWPGDPPCETVSFALDRTTGDHAIRGHTHSLPTPAFPTHMIRYARITSTTHPCHAPDPVPCRAYMRSSSSHTHGAYECNTSTRALPFAGTTLSVNSQPHTYPNTPICVKEQATASPYQHTMIINARRKNTCTPSRPPSPRPPHTTSAHSIFFESCPHRHHTVVDSVHTEHGPSWHSLWHRCSRSPALPPSRGYY